MSSLRRAHLNRIPKFVKTFLIGSLLIVGYVPFRPSHARLTLEISSSVSSSAELFYDVGRSFNEADAQTLPVYSESLTSFQTLQFDLPSGYIYAIRFDPLTRAGKVRIRNITIAGILGTVLRIPPSSVSAYNQIQDLTKQQAEVNVSTTPDSNDSSLLFKLDHPINLTFRHEMKVALVLDALLFAVLVAAFLSADSWLRLLEIVKPRIERLARTAVPIAKKLSVPGFIQFDHYAIWFYALIGLIGLLFGIAGLNGSSAGYYKIGFGLGQSSTPLAGSAKKIRNDEWVFETPAILNEALRPQPFSFNQSPMGDDSVTLIANVPVRHTSTLFRPQFWPFFLFTPTYAFSFYWQAKGLLLILGVFTWLLLITQSTMWAAAGSLWYFFSPFVQWDYSWESCIPEAVGLLCFSMVFWSFLTVGRRSFALTICAIAAATCSIDFAMCGYPPHVVPLVWVAVPFFVSWCIAHRTMIFRREQAFLRISIIAAAALLVAFVGLIVFLDVRHAITELSDTVYPGKRRVGGGGFPLQALTSHFFNWAESEDHCLPLLANICEASGFLWLAPVTLFLIGKIELDRTRRFLLSSLWLSCIGFLVWMIFPVPAGIGTVFGMQLVFFNRSVPALGLVNVAIVALCVSARRRFETASDGFELTYLSGGVFLSALAMLILTNQSLSSYFTLREVLITTVFLTTVVVLILTFNRIAVASILVISQAALFGTVNPIQRGLGVVTDSQLFTFMQRNKQYRTGKWIVFSGEVAPSGFLIAVGCDVYTGLRLLPDVKHFPVFLARGMKLEAFDRAGYLLATAINPETKISFESPVSYAARLNVNPADPLLKELGIRFVAFDRQPVSGTSTGLVPIGSGPIDHLWLYKIP